MTKGDASVVREGDIQLPEEGTGISMTVFSPREERMSPDMRKSNVEDEDAHQESTAYTNNRDTRDEEKKNKLFLEYRWRIMISLWALGLVNNFHYNLVIAASDSLAAQYNMKHLVALVSFSNVFFGIIARVLNAFVANRLSFNLRMTIMVTMTIIGLFLNAFSAPLGGYHDGYSFLVLIVGVSFSGTAYSYGEAVALTFLQRYPSDMVGAWGSGTGISGVITSLLYILLTNYGVSKRNIFLFSSPLTIVYWLTFCVALVAPQKVIKVTQTNGEVRKIVVQRGKEDEVVASLGSENISVDDYDFEMVSNLKGLSWHSIPRQKVSQEVMEVLNIKTDPTDLHYPCCEKCLGCLSTRNFLRDWWNYNGKDIVFVHRVMWWFFLNLAVVYVAEYAAQFMAPFSFYCTEDWQSNFFIRHSFPITQLCYQAGVFISRSSLSFVKIKAVGVLSILQLINAVAWIIQAKTLVISSKSSLQKEVGLSFILFVWMIYVGLVAGSSYVNCFFLILQRNIASQETDIQLRMSEAAYRSTHREGDEEARKPNEITGHPVVSSSDEESNDEGDEEREELLANARRHLAESWQRRRELAMATGSLYGMCGICLGTILDVLFTNTLLKNTSSCKN